MRFSESRLTKAIRVTQIGKGQPIDNHKLKATIKRFAQFPADVRDKFIQDYFMLDTRFAAVYLAKVKYQRLYMKLI
jgi:hypothetical protein